MAQSTTLDVESFGYKPQIEICNTGTKTGPHTFSYELDDVKETEVILLSQDGQISQYLSLDFINGMTTPLIKKQNEYIKFKKLDNLKYQLTIIQSPIEIFSSILGQENVAASSWMKDLGSMNSDSLSLGKLSLADIVLPGTHDSGTFNLTLHVVEPPDSFVGDIDQACAILNSFGIEINCNDTQEVAEVLSLPWSVTQVTDWYGQLQTGCRSFDYRGYYNTNTSEWVAQHSLYGTSLTSPSELTKQVTNFLQQNEGEIVVIEYSIYGDGDKNDLVSQFLAGLGEYGYNWDSGVILPGNPSISEMIGNNQRAIIVEANGGQRSPVSSGIVNDYPDSCNKTQILSYDANAIELFAQELPNAMRKIGYQDTPDVECIVFGTIGSLVIPGNLECEKYFGFSCSIDLMGYIDQLNALFSLSYVLDSYSTLTPISKAQYFGNIWNFDHPGLLFRFLFL